MYATSTQALVAMPVPRRERREVTERTSGGASPGLLGEPRSEITLLECNVSNIIQAGCPGDAVAAAAAGNASGVPDAAVRAFLAEMGHSALSQEQEPLDQ